MKWRLLLALVVLAIVSRPTVRRATSAAQSIRTPLAFTHVTVIDAAHAVAQDDQTVLLAGDRIADVGKTGTVTIPADAQVVDAPGRFLIPGLWDMHVHTFRHSPRSTNDWFFSLFIANGVTGVRDMWATADDFPQIVRWRKGIDDGTFVGPRFGAVGWLVDGPEPVWEYSDVVRTPQEAREFVHRVKATGIDFVKVYTKLRPEEYFAIADEAKKVGIPFAGHVPDAVRAAAAGDAGQRTMEHLRNVDLGCSSKEEELMQAKAWGPQQAKEMRDTYDQQKCEQLLAKFARNQTWQVPTNVLFLGDRSLLRSLLTDSRSKYLPSDVRARWEQQLPKLETSPRQEEQRQRNQQERLAIIAMMNKAGVPMMAGTDVGNPFLFPGFSVHDELTTFVQAGLTPGEALKTATYNPARFLGMLDLWYRRKGQAGRPGTARCESAQGHPEHAEDSGGRAERPLFRSPRARETAGRRGRDSGNTVGLPACASVLRAFRKLAGRLRNDKSRSIFRCSPGASRGPAQKSVNTSPH